MLPTNLGHSCQHSLGHHHGICKHLSPNHNLFQAFTNGRLACWVELNSTLHCTSAVFSNENISCDWTSSMDVTYSSKTIWSIRKVKWLKIVPIRFAFHTNLSMLAIHCRCARDPIKQIAKLCQFQPAKYYVASIQSETKLLTHSLFNPLFCPCDPFLPSLGLSFQPPILPNIVVQQLLWSWVNNKQH